MLYALCDLSREVIPDLFELIKHLFHFVQESHFVQVIFCSNSHGTLDKILTLNSRSRSNYLTTNHVSSLLPEGEIDMS